MIRRLLGRPPKPPKPEVPKVWVTINGFPFYIPVTDPFVELYYGRSVAAYLREGAR